MIAKWAMTIDGRIATASGESQWITGKASRADVHRLRSRVDAIAVGMGTVVADNPMLNARNAETDRAPQRIASRVVFCRNRLPALESRLVTTARQIPLLLVVGRSMEAGQGVDRGHLEQLQALGAEPIVIDTDVPSEMINEALDQLGRREMTNLMVEGGSELLASFFAVDQLDECHVYIGASSLRRPGGAGADRRIGNFSAQRCAAFRSDGNRAV